MTISFGKMLVVKNITPKNFRYYFDEICDNFAKRSRKKKVIFKFNLKYMLFASF